MQRAIVGSVLPPLLALALAAAPASADRSASFETSQTGLFERPAAAPPCGTTLPDDALPDNALIEFLTAWIRSVAELPPPDTLPKFRVASSEVMARVFADQGSTGTSIRHPVGPLAVEALYDTRSGTITLPLTWRPSPTGLSAVVHELVHHMQLQSGRGYACVGEREAQAYAVQAKWLALFGLSLEESFEIDRLTLLLLTNCGM